VPERDWTAVDEYLEAKLLPDDPVLAAAAAAAVAGGLPPIAVAPNQGRLLQLLVRILRARDILEIGTLGAYSTIWMARALPPGGRLVTLELSEHHAEVARANLERAEVADKVEIRLGPALDTLAEMVKEGTGPFDFIFIDADKENTRGYFERSIELAHPGTLIFVDNLVRDGELIDGASTDTRVLGMREFMDYAATEKRVDATAVQTVGSKGYDGFALAYVTRT
jgi:predicted O-methyltransferase YrrM